LGAEPGSVLKPAAAYFGLVFGTGFVLGAIRVPFLVPAFGDRIAELIEAPLMLVAIVLAARWVVRRPCAGCGPATLLAVGAIAAGLVLAADVAVGLGLRGMTLAQVFFDRDAVSGAVYYALIALFAAMPAIVGRRGAGGRATPSNQPSAGVGRSREETRPADRRG